MKNLEKRIKTVYEEFKTMAEMVSKESKEIAEQNKEKADTLSLIDRYIEIGLKRKDTEQLKLKLAYYLELYSFSERFSNLDEGILEVYKVIKSETPKPYYVLINGELKPREKETVDKIIKFNKENPQIVEAIQKSLTKE